MRGRADLAPSPREAAASKAKREEKNTGIWVNPDFYPLIRGMDDRMAVLDDRQVFNLFH
jgi:hypothetical protein